MVVAQISMGQGNQMFQYAAGRALSLHLNVPFKLDITSYQGYKVRRYELSEYFTIDTPIASAEELKAFQYTHPVKRMWNKLMPASQKLRQLGLGYESSWLPRTLLQGFDRVQPPHQRIVYEEPHYHFDKHFFNAHNNIFLKGYWMSYKYFAPFEEQIRKILRYNHHW